MSFAKTHIQSFSNFENELNESRTFLCALEAQGFMPFDELWHEHSKLDVPEKCLVKNQAPKSYKNLRVRSVSIRRTDEMRCWDQKIEWNLDGKVTQALFLRQDKKYVGVHSTRGWSAWIERKQGSFRYEFGDLETQTHFRIKGSGRLHPVKGNLEELDELELLHVKAKDKEALQATSLVGSKKLGLRWLSFEGAPGTWQKTKDQCHQSTLCQREKPREITEVDARTFVSIGSVSYLDFVQAGRPLAFVKVEPSELIPRVSPYR